VRGGAGGSAYVAAKHGIEGMVKSVAAEGRPHRITANSVGPGCALTPTGATREQVRSDDHAAGGGGLTDAELARLFPMGTAERKRWTDPAMLAPAFAWLGTRPTSGPQVLSGAHTSRAHQPAS
jgi:3-hydroxybutyrate dehydrogenase